MIHRSQLVVFGTLFLILLIGNWCICSYPIDTWMGIESVGALFGTAHVHLSRWLDRTSTRACFQIFCSSSITLACSSTKQNLALYHNTNNLSVSQTRQLFSIISIQNSANGLVPMSLWALSNYVGVVNKYVGGWGSLYCIWGIRHQDLIIHNSILGTSVSQARPESVHRMFLR